MAFKADLEKSSNLARLLAGFQAESGESHCLAMREDGLVFCAHRAAIGVQ